MAAYRPLTCFLNGIWCFILLHKKLNQPPLESAKHVNISTDDQNLNTEWDFSVFWVLCQAKPVSGKIDTFLKYNFASLNYKRGLYGNHLQLMAAFAVLWFSPLAWYSCSLTGDCKWSYEYVFELWGWDSLWSLSMCRGFFAHLERASHLEVTLIFLHKYIAWPVDV